MNHSCNNGHLSYFLLSDDAHKFKNSKNSMRVKLGLTVRTFTNTDNSETGKSLKQVKK